MMMQFYEQKNSASDNFKLAICVILTPMAFFAMWWFI